MSSNAVLSVSDFIKKENSYAAWIFFPARLTMPTCSSVSLSCLIASFPVDSSWLRIHRSASSSISIVDPAPSKGRLSCKSGKALQITLFGCVVVHPCQLAWVLLNSIPAAIYFSQLSPWSVGIQPFHHTSRYPQLCGCIRSVVPTMCGYNFWLEIFQCFYFKACVFCPAPRLSFCSAFCPVSHRYTESR